MKDFEQYIINKYDSKERLTKKEIKELIWNYEYERIEGKNRRWSRWVDVIIKLKDRYFKIAFDEGLTEMQPDEYYTDIEEVKPVEKTIVITEWETISSTPN